MLKTNSKKARENIRNYIMNNFTPDGYTETPPETWHDVAQFIFDTFRENKYYSMEYIRAHKMSLQDVFIDWCSGLPSILDTCYYYNRSAVDDLAAILEETESEKARYTESDAEKMLSILIYMELTREVKSYV